PTRGPSVGHHDDQPAPAREVDDVVLEVKLAEVLRAAVAQVEDRVSPPRGLKVVLGQEHVDRWLPPDLRRGESVVVEPATLEDARLRDGEAEAIADGMRVFGEQLVVFSGGQAARRWQAEAERAPSGGPTRSLQETTATECGRFRHVSPSRDEIYIVYTWCDNKTCSTPGIRRECPPGVTASYRDP